MASIGYGAPDIAELVLPTGYSAPDIAHSTEYSLYWIPENRGVSLSEWRQEKNTRPQWRIPETLIKL